MKRFLTIALICFAALLNSGCKPSSQNAGQGNGSSLVPPLPTKAQPRLPTIKLWLGAQEMNAEMAVSLEQVETGMMFRTNMGPNDGMIFVFGAPFQASFWMKNTLVPLSAAYIDPNGTILEIHDLQPQNTNEVVAATDHIQFVLETPQGWFQSNHIDVGTLVKTEKGPLASVFRGQGM
jgi:uncharacterized membrane protein (UPF0127 family)